MPADASIVADPANGLAFVAGRPIAMESRDASGAIRFGGTGGTQLRPLAFAERTEIVTSATSRDGVAAAVLAAATVEAGVGDRVMLEVLALWLAGAAWDAPPFAETTLRVARASGWPPEQLFSAPATEVDRLAAYLDEHRRDDDGWNTIVFAGATCEDVNEVRARYADRLLHRGATASAESASEGLSSSRASSPVLSFRANTQADGTRLLRGDDATFGMRSSRAFDQGRASVSPRSDVDRWGSSSSQDDAVRGTSDAPSHGLQTFTRLETPATLQSFATAPTPAPVEDRRPRLSVLGTTGAKASSSDLGSGNGAASENARENGTGDRRVRLPSAGHGPGTGTGTRTSAPAREPRFTHEAEESAATVHAFALPSFLDTPEPQPEPAQVRADAFDVASALAALLDDEADLRGVTR